MLTIKVDGNTAKRRVIRVSDKIKDASTDINNAKVELNNVEYVDLSYEIDQLEIMYKKNNDQVSQFETYATTLKNMIDDYVGVDKDCATKIKSSGENHRENTGLAKNLALATIHANIDKLDHKLDDIKDWAEGAVDWLKTSISDDWDSYIQGILAGVQVVSSGVILGACLFATFTGVAAPVSLPMAAAAGVSFLTGIDKLVGSVADITNYKETDGKSMTQAVAEEEGNEGYKEAFDVVDFTSSMYTGPGAITKIDSLKNITTVNKLAKTLNVTSNITKGVDFIEDIYDVDTESINNKIGKKIIKSILT